MLENTSLASVIKTSRVIADRLDFIAGLDSLVFDAETKKLTKERSELHRILANETWVFANEYTLTGDDDRARSFARADEPSVHEEKVQSRLLHRHGSRGLSPWGRRYTGQLLRVRTHAAIASSQPSVSRASANAV